jgi:hypothetical protein
MFDMIAPDSGAASTRYKKVCDDFAEVFGDKASPCGLTGPGLVSELTI